MYSKGFATSEIPFIMGDNLRTTGCKCQFENHVVVRIR